LIGTTEATKLFFDLQSALETDLASNLHNTTVSAIRLDIHLTFATTAVVGDRARIGWGMGWFQNDAIAAGVASLPNPLDDHFDWVAHGTREVICDVAAVISRPRDGLIEVRNDSMRKQRENHSTFGCVVSANNLSDTLLVTIGGRVLFLLP